MPQPALAALATILGVVPHGNRLEIRLNHGAAEVVWVDPGVFRFRRSLDGPLPAAETAEREPVEMQIEELPGSIRARTKLLEVTLQRRGALLRVRRYDGSALMEDMAEARRAGPAIAWERRIAADARYYGLGPREDAVFDLRGLTPSPPSPFLYSTAGYAEYHPAPGPYRFDFTARDRFRIEAPSIDYYFYYGPTIKQAFEDHNRVRGSAALWPAGGEGPGSWTTLAASLHRILQGGISAAIAPTLSLAAYARAPAELQTRARQLLSLVAEVSPGSLGLSTFRGQLASFFDIYAAEGHDKGYPVWHPLPFQFPDDPECARHADEFMLGDEMLVAPIVEPGGKRSLYLPQGVWTNLETNEALPGRRTITVATESLPVYARNGTIVPLDSEAGMALHYFPTLAAEFFLIDEEGYTQIHAAPAADEMRLEIESKKSRAYEWIVHHVDRPASVGFEERKFREVTGPLSDGTWRYDAAARNLLIRVQVAASGDSIVNLEW